MKSTFAPIRLMIVAVLFWTACGTDTPAGSSSTAGADSTGMDDVTMMEEVVPVRTAPSCDIPGEVLEGNQLWLPEYDLIAVVKADDTTNDEDYGPGHRLLELYRGSDCERLFRQELKVSGSPDFPYYLGDIQYNKTSGLLGVRGFYDVYVCALADGYTLTGLTPEFRGGRESDDPQSGMIKHLEVWESYLMGYAEDFGPFAFDCGNPEDIEPLLPFAEWQDGETGEFHSMFLVPSDGEIRQAVMPYLDPETGDFQLFPLFERPQAISTNVPNSARNNRFLVLRGAGGNEAVYALDLGTRTRVNLPADVASQPTQQILE
ncbi:MAG: hypothetical protein KDC54_22465, partial [Lewinella sp.]|nr:hypothetical protein [Lewinella sp.]